MAHDFLACGCAVMVSGRTRETVAEALARLRREFPGADLYGVPCDTGSCAQVEALWEQSVKSMGGVDHWINNAGIGQPTAPMWELAPELVDAIVRTDLLGVLYGARAAMRGMAARGAGAIWFMEGHGSNGRNMRGLSFYGAAKRSIRYVAAALAIEARGTGIVVGALSPGIMITDFTMMQIERNDHKAWDRTRKVFNILADRPETVAAFLVPRILNARRPGIRIAWLTSAKILYRFMTAGIMKRKVIDD